MYKNCFEQLTGLSLATMLSCFSPADAIETAPVILKSSAKTIQPSNPLNPTEQTGTTALPVTPDVRLSIAALRKKKLRLPLDGADPEQMKGNFYLGRLGHLHQAVDMVAARNTPIHAVEAGTIERLLENVRGGLTIYQLDPSGKFVYYYAHLERYDQGIHQGDAVKKGQVIGYVGTSGNAPPNTPHLHFAISTINSQDSVFKGTPLDPYEVFKTRGQ